MGICSVSSDQVTIRTNDVHDCWGKAIGLYDGVDILIEDNLLHDIWHRQGYSGSNHGDIVQYQHNSPDGTQNVIFRRNKLYDAYGQGIAIEAQLPDNPFIARNIIVENNLICGTLGGTPFVIRDTNDFKIINNTITADSRVSSAVTSVWTENGIVCNNIIKGIMSNGCDSSVFKNNIIENWSTDGGGYLPNVNPSSGNVICSGIYKTPTGPDAIDFADLDFFGFCDYHLGANSVAIDYGVPTADLNDIVADDIDKNQRDSYPDIGCYEFDEQYSPPDPPPQSPSNLVAIVISPNEIYITWSDNSDDELGFKIERHEESDLYIWNQIAKPPPNNIGYSDTNYGFGLQPGTTYYYRIRAYNENGNSQYNPGQVFITTPPIPDSPADLTLLASSKSTIAFSWTHNNLNTSGFIIERAPDIAGAPGQWTQVDNTPKYDTTCYDTGLDSNTIYHYRVCAYSDWGRSPWNSSLTVSTD